MLLGPNASNSLSQDLEFVQKKHASLSLQLDLDKNKSNLALSALYRSRVDYRDKEEETLSIHDKELELIKKALERNSGKRKAAAIELGISERTLYRKIKQHDIEL